MSNYTTAMNYETFVRNTKKYKSLSECREFESVHAFEQLMDKEQHKGSSLRSYETLRKNIYEVIKECLSIKKANIEMRPLKDADSTYFLELIEKYG